jgi:hypothetical protein
VGSADKPNLQGVSTATPTVRRPDANSITFITHSADIWRMLNHIEVQSESPHISQACGAPMREDCDEQVGEDVQIEPDWDLVGQPAINHELDQRIN